MKKNMKNTVKWGDFQAVVYQKKALIKQEV